MTTSLPNKRIEDLFNETFHSLVFTSFGIVKDYSQAEDIVQNTYVKIWQNYEKVSHIKNLKSYVYRAVRNSSLNFIRDNKLVNSELTEVEHLSDDDNLDDESRKSELSNKIHQAVDKLPDNWKEAFILSKYEKLKYYEIAEEMSISNKTVEKYISKALAFLRLELKMIIIFIITILFSHKL